jgi:cAMP-binding proteins - catabolite gene activator and regulatory subunit of cAMP-dependent protein kinases
MEAFIDYVLQFGNLNKRQIDLISGKASTLTLHKGDNYWEAGKRVNQIGFLIKGTIRVYYYNHKGEEITRYFIDENHLILSGYTIEEIYTPSEYLAAVTDCTMIVFSKQDWKEIADTIIGWDAILQKITAKYHKEKIARRSGLISQDATTRYLDFMAQFPALANRVPLSYIASYLGITQSSLSRIRKNIR